MACVKKDESGFVNFWDCSIHVPAPVYGDRLCLWPALAARFGGAFPPAMSLSGLAHISEGQPTLSLVKIMRRILVPRRLETLEKRPITEAECVLRLSAYPSFVPEDPEEDPEDIRLVLLNWEKVMPGFRRKYGEKADEEPEADAKPKGKGKK